MGPGGLPSLQNCAGVGDPGTGGFDSHAPSPRPCSVSQTHLRPRIVKERRFLHPEPSARAEHTPLSMLVIGGVAANHGSSKRDWQW